MKSILLRLRFYLEIIALPAFIFLVIHLSGHGLSILIEGEAHVHETHSWWFNEETLSGILLFILFTYLWHRPALKKWVPCSHDHCHTENKKLHLLATTALCLHFFPEAGVRHALIEKALGGEIASTLGIIGFLSHFLIDVIVALILSSYWKKRSHQIINFMIISTLWVMALLGAPNFLNYFPPSAEGILLILSAFLLSMFIHPPHRPVHCKSCKC